MAQYDTTTPGSAVAATIQEILARRRAEEQQEFINKFKLAEMAESRADREERNRQAREQEARQSRLTDSQLATDVLQRAGLRKQDMPIGATPEQYPGIPEEEAKALFQSVTPQGPTPEGEPMAPIRFFPGTETQREAERKRAFGEELVAGYPNLRSEAQLALRAGIEGISIPAWMGAGPTKVVPPGFRGEIPAGTNVLQAPYPPQPQLSAANNPNLYDIYDKETGQRVRTIPLTTGQVVPYQEANPTHELFKLGDKPSTVGLTGEVTRRLVVSNLMVAAARKQVQENKDKWGTPNPDADRNLVAAEAERVAAVASGLNEAAVKYNMSPAVQQAVREILTNPTFAGVPVSIAVTELEVEGPEQFGPKALSTIQRVVDLFRGVELAPAAPIVQ